MKAGEDLRPVWRKLRAPLKKAQRDHIAEMKDQRGRKFQNLAPSTVERRLSRGGKAKKFTKKGKLRKTAQRRLGRILSKKLISRARVKITRRSISLYARGAMAHALHGGGKAGKRRRSKLPSRRYIYVDDPLARAAFDKVAAHVASSFEKGRVAK